MDVLGDVNRFVSDAIGAVSNVVNAPVKAVESVANVSNTVSSIRKYWYVPIIIGGVIVGYTLIKKSPAGMAGAIARASMDSLLTEYE